MARLSLERLPLIAALLLCRTAHALPRSAPSPLVPSLLPSVHSLRRGVVDSSSQQACPTSSSDIVGLTDHSQVDILDLR